MSSNCSSIFSETSSTKLLQQLRIVIESGPESWAYSIMWEASLDSNGDLVLAWNDGHFQGTKMFASEAKNDDNDWDIDLLLDNNVTDTELFFSVSMTLSFPIGKGESSILEHAFSSGTHIWLAGDHEMQLYNCDRVKNANGRGIQTLVCISTAYGVVELGSLHVIQEDLGLVQIVKSIFGTKVFNMAHNPRGGNNYQSPCSTVIQDAEENTIILDENNQQKVCIKMEPNDSFLDTGSLSDYEGRIGDKHLASTTTRNHRKKARKVEQGMKETYIDHVEAERQRRDRLNQRFCALRSVVPYVSKLDKASLLGDAVAYIKDLQARNNELEDILGLQEKSSKKSKLNYTKNCGYQSPSSRLRREVGGRMEMDMQIVGSEAIMQVRCPDVNFPAARLLNALTELNFKVSHASITTVNEMVFQDIVARVPDGYCKNEEATKALILQILSS